MYQLPLSHLYCRNTRRKGMQLRAGCLDLVDGALVINKGICITRARQSVIQIYFVAEGKGKLTRLAVGLGTLYVVRGSIAVWILYYLTRQYWILLM